MSLVIRVVKITLVCVIVVVGSVRTVIRIMLIGIIVSLTLRMCAAAYTASLAHSFTSLLC